MGEEVEDRLLLPALALRSVSGRPTRLHGAFRIPLGPAVVVVVEGRVPFVASLATSQQPTRETIRHPSVGVVGVEVVPWRYDLAGLRWLLNRLWKRL